MIFLVSEDCLQCVKGLPLFRILNCALEARRGLMEFAKGDSAAGVGVGRRLVHSGTPSPNGVAHVLDPAYVLVGESRVAGRRTSVEHVERAGHSFLLQRHDLASSGLVVWKYGIILALLKAV